jgi:hypothetical protein
MDVCPLGAALSSAQMNDDVTLETGVNFPVQAVQLPTVPDGVTIHGAPGAPATIPSTANTLLFLNPGVTLRDVTIAGSGGTGSTTVQLFGAAVLERSYIDAGPTNNTACTVVGNGALLRDSVCRNEAPSKTALDISASGGETDAVTLRNVTAVDTAANGTGITAGASAASTKLSVFATNVIADGDSAGVLADIHATSDGTLGSSASVVLDHSNYATILAQLGGSITAAGAGTNTTDQPAYTNAPVGDFSELPSSTATIDRGTSNLVNGIGLGALALSGTARCQGAAPDIGAYELAGSPCPVAATSPLITTPQPRCKKGKKLKKVHGKKKCTKKKKKRR